MPYKKLSIDQMAYLMNHGSSMTVLELSRFLKISTTKIRNELEKLNITPPVKQVHTYLNPNVRRFPKHKIVSGLLPKTEVPFERPKAQYTNSRYLYQEIAQIQ